MVRHIGVHRANDGNVVNTPADMGKNLADFDAALAVSFEFVRRGKRRAGFPFGFQILHRQLFAGVFFQRRFGIEGVHVRRPAVGENMNHMFGFGRKLRLPGHERRNIATRRLRRGGERLHAAEKRGQTQRAHAHTAAAQKLAPGQK